MSEQYELVIVGAGSGGLSAAAFAAQLGARVALVEKNRVGGDCTWSGCVPSKTLLKTAKVAHDMRTARRYGLPAAEPEVDLNAVMACVRDVIGEIAREESPEALRANGIEVVLGKARFVDPHTLVAGDTTLAARRFLIATGSHPFTPPIRGLRDVDYLTYETVWDMKTLPRSLLVVGGGPVGCEMAQSIQHARKPVHCCLLVEWPRNRRAVSDTFRQWTTGMVVSWAESLQSTGRRARKTNGPSPIR